MTFLSNCHGLPNIIWHTSMGITSHGISSLYPPILISTRHCLVIITWCPFCSHETLYGLGCAIVFNSNFSTISVDTRLSVLPLSMITLHTLSLVLQAVLKRLFLCTGFSIYASGFKRTFLNIRDALSSAPSASTSLCLASEM
jgi:hypothetical protein